MSTEKVLALAKKLHALAIHGVDGEKENATVMLEKLMKQHNITFDMIEGIETKEYIFYIADKRLFMQVISSVIGNGKRFSFTKNDRKKEKAYWITCTAAQAIEIQAKYQFYKAAYDEEIEILYLAFIHKHDIFAKSTGEEKKERKIMTKEELEQMERMLDMMQGIKHRVFLKQIK